MPMRSFFLCFLSVFVFLTPISAFAAMQDYPIVKLQALDKSTARTVTFEAKVGTTIEYGSLSIKIQSCRKSEPLDKPESASFLQIWEVPLYADKSKWIFSGWMFASSPALSAMDHAVYDVWVLDCLEKVKKKSSLSKTGSKKKTADQTELEAVENVPEEKKEGAEDIKKPQVETAPAKGKKSSSLIQNTSPPTDGSIDSVIKNLENNE